MSESELFEYLKRYWFDLKMSKDQYSKHDCFSKSTKTRIELKCRKTHYNDLMLERSKYIHLMVNLRKLKPKWIIDNRMPKTTDFENTNKVEKEYCLISIDNSNII